MVLLGLVKRVDGCKRNDKFIYVDVYILYIVYGFFFIYLVFCCNKYLYCV